MTTSDRPGCLPKFLRFLAPRPSAVQPSTSDAAAPSAPLPYRLRDAFLTSAEASFYRVLKSIVNTGAGSNLIICPKVDLDDIFYVSGPDQNYTYWNKINRKHVDFLLIDPVTLHPLLAIELDDASHQRPDRVERDRFVDQVFATAGLPLLHVPVKPAYSPAEITNLIRTALQPSSAAPLELDLRVEPPAATQPVAPAYTSDNPPLCPKCGVRMVLRTARRGDKAGQPFYGCPNFPNCRIKIPIPRA